MFTAMMCDVFRGHDDSINYRTDGGTFNLRRFQAKTTAVQDVIRNFIFADDRALESGSTKLIQMF